MIRMMSLLEQAPRFDAADAIALARDLYALDASAAPLPSECDQNFLLQTSGARFVLKIANASEPRPLLEAQNAAMRHVAVRTGLCPRIVPTASGEEIAEAGGHYVRLLSWIPGTPLAFVRQRPASLLEELGRRLGELDAALASFDHPAIHREFHWDLASAPAVVRRNLTLVSDPALAALVERTSAACQDRAASLSRLPRSAVHNDANDHNVIVDEGRGRIPAPRINGLVDFGDIVHTATVADLAIAIAYAILDAHDPLSTAEAIARGYQSVRTLDDLELAALWPLVKLRLCASVCIAAEQQPHRPGDAYLSISQAPIRRSLPVLDAIENERAAEAFRAARERGRLAARRRALVGSSVRLAYGSPVTIVRGSMQYLFDDAGRRYIDCYNNVPHVGHCHPKVVEAAAAQLRELNTNTRYLHDALPQFAERLVATMPAPLRICYFVNSGSEANELALRLARAHTRGRDAIVLDAAYHGNTTTLIDISPYKFNGPGGTGCPPWVHVVPIPDVYRGPHKRDDPDAGAKYAAAVADAVSAVERTGHRLAAFIAETCPSVGGQIVFPPGYLPSVYAQVRAAGGLCIADEVQTAYGRMGSAFYAFEDQGVVPDIVVLGKPIGNGYPLGAVVTTEPIARSFDNGMEFFSTFGGSTVSCAVGRAVLDVVVDDDLQTHARLVGRHLLGRLDELASRHAIVGDVRGSGLFIGVELVRSHDGLEPATDEAGWVVERLREEGILLGTDGPAHNVLKVRPPMPFDVADADALVSTLDGVLGELAP
jgi:4-aminobutyrate aminotransferase-like enzyme/aminoglycoside phosphotransferase (APT) family kinase protein